MRSRKSQDARRAEVLAHARALFMERGYGACQMEDIRKVAGLSRGGLYHHFDNKAAILAALVDLEIRNLAEILEKEPDPVVAMIQAGSVHLGADAGIIDALKGEDEVNLYLSQMEEAVQRRLGAALEEAIAGGISAGRYAAVNPRHAASLFLAINSHINRGVLLKGWAQDEAMAFAALSLTAFARLLDAENDFKPLIRKLEGGA